MSQIMADENKIFKRISNSQIYGKEKEILNTLAGDKE